MRIFTYSLIIIKLHFLFAFSIEITNKSGLFTWTGYSNWVADFKHALSKEILVKEDHRDQYLYINP